MISAITTLWPTISEGIEIAGKLVELIGAYLTIRRAFSTTSRIRIPKVILSATARGKAARRAAHLAQFFSEENFIYILQGFSLIMIGIMLQIMPYAVSFIHGII
jgi:hypothetical protein